MRFSCCRECQVHDWNSHREICDEAVKSQVEARDENDKKDMTQIKNIDGIDTMRGGQKEVDTKCRGLLLGLFVGVFVVGIAVIGADEGRSVGPGVMAIWQFSTEIFVTKDG